MVSGKLGDVIEGPDKKELCFFDYHEFRRCFGHRNELLFGAGFDRHRNLGMACSVPVDLRLSIQIPTVLRQKPGDFGSR